MKICGFTPASSYIMHRHTRTETPNGARGLYDWKEIGNVNSQRRDNRVRANINCMGFESIFI